MSTKKLKTKSGIKEKTKKTAPDQEDKKTIKNTTSIKTASLQNKEKPKGTTKVVEASKKSTKTLAKDTKKPSTKTVKPPILNHEKNSKKIFGKFSPTLFTSLLLLIIVIIGLFGFSATIFFKRKLQNPGPVIQATNFATARDQLSSVKEGEKKILRNDILVEVIKTTENQEIKQGQFVTIKLRAFKENGEEFINSDDLKDEVTLRFGRGNAFPSLDIGLAGARVGEIRRITTPASMAYGEQLENKPQVPVPAGSIVIFEIEILKALNEEVYLDQTIRNSQSNTKPSQ